MSQNSPPPPISDYIYNGHFQKLSSEKAQEGKNQPLLAKTGEFQY